MDSNVIIIPRKNPIQVDAATGTLVRKKVAAYARVSTDEKDQLNSFNTQKIEYERRIKENPEWEFVGLYADEGITGTNLKKREGFKKMIEDALNKKIDLILVKSISRFARNTLDCINYKRQLAAAGVEVFFEKENIYTLKEDSETMITIHAALAQDESRQISTNVSWGNRARMRSGTYRGLNKKNLGYIIKENNEFEIEEEGKETVQLIYKLFINGFSYRRIVSYLTENQRKNFDGKVEWNVASINRILTNEKYCGDLIFQKTYTVSYLTHETRKNEGQVEQFLFANHHEPIISKDTFMYVQLLRQRRVKDYDPVIDNGNSQSVSGIVYCASCGRKMNRIHYTRNNGYSRFVLTCKRQNTNKYDYTQCSQSETLDSELINSLVSYLLKDRIALPNKELLEDSISQGLAIAEFGRKNQELIGKIRTLENELTDAITKQVKSPIALENFQANYSKMQEEINRAKLELESLKEDTLEKHKNNERIRVLLNFIDKSQPFSLRIVYEFIKRIYRLKDNSLLVIFSKRTLSDEEYQTILNSDISSLTLHEFNYNDRKIKYRIKNMEEEIC